MVPTGKATGQTTIANQPGNPNPPSQGSAPIGASPRMTPKLPASFIYVLTVVTFLAGFWIANQGGPFIDSRSFPSLVTSVGIIGESTIVLLPLWFAAAGFGWPLRRFLAPSAEHPRIVQVGAGLAVLLMADMLLGCLGVLDRNNAWILCAIGIGMLICQIALRARGNTRTISFLAPNPPLGLVLAAPAVGLLFVAATCPPSTLWAVEAYGYDVRSYHLQLPKEWLAEGQIVGLPHNVYSYLPNLVEAGYMQIGAMRGSMYSGIYAAQLFHASCAVFAAVALFALVRSRTGRPGPAVLTAAVFLALPWVTITASMAYNEATVLALGATALLVAFERGVQTDVTTNAGKALVIPGPGRRLPGAILIGFLVGAATLAKLPTGPMLAVPLGLILLFALNRQHDESPLTPPLPVAPGAAWWLRWLGALRKFLRTPAANHPVSLAAAAAVAGTLTLSPYLIRNYIWTHNPVFPFATEQFGQAHWADYNVARWSAGHGPVGDLRDRVEALGKQWIFNVGYGATEGVEREVRPNTIEKRNIAHFGSEWGFPIFWTAALVGAGLGLWSPSYRRLTVGALVVVGVGVAFWLATTHLQSRFLLPTVLPGCILVGIAATRLVELRGDKMPFAFGASAMLFVVVLVQVNFGNYFSQFTIVHDDKGVPFRVPPWMVAGSLVPESAMSPTGFAGPGDDSLNYLPTGAKVLIIADNTHLLFHRVATIYNSAFDDNLLGMLIRGGRPPLPAQLPPAVTAWLDAHPIKFSGPRIPDAPVKAPKKAGKSASGVKSTTRPATTKPAKADASAASPEPVNATAPSGSSIGPSIGAPPKPTFDPVAVTSKLKAMGITHVWIHWSELDRLTETYGFDPDVNRVTIERLVSGANWTVDEMRTVRPIATLFQIADVPEEEFNPEQEPRRRRNRDRR